MTDDIKPDDVEETTDTPDEDEEEPLVTTDSPTPDEPKVEDDEGQP